MNSNVPVTDTVKLQQRRRRIAIKMSPRIVIVFLIASLFLLVIFPVGMLLYGSFLGAAPGAPGAQLTLVNYVTVFSDPTLLSVLGTTLIFAGASTVLAVVFGGYLAWYIMRTNAPFKHFIFLTTLSFYIWPYFVKAIAYVFTLGPKGGVLNLLIMKALGLTEPVFNVFSLAGMVFVEGMVAAPLMMLIMMGAFAIIDPSFEESARIAGAGILRSLVMSIAILRPAVMSGALLIFLIGLESFDIPIIIGWPAQIFVFTTKIFDSINFNHNFRVATAYAALLLIITIGGVYVYRRLTAGVDRYVTASGKIPRRTLVDLGKWRYLMGGLTILFITTTFIFPMAVLILASFVRSYTPDLRVFSQLTLTNYADAILNPLMIRAMTNSMLITVVGSTVAVFFVALIAYVTVRTKSKGRTFLDLLATIPIAFPGIVLAVGFLWAYISTPILGVLYGTVWIIMLAYIAKYLPFANRMLAGSLIQVAKEMEESARTCGASWLGSIKDIIFPLTKPGLIATWIFLMIHFIKELSVSVLLYGVGGEVVSIVIYQKWFNLASIELVGAMSVLLAVIVFALYFVATKLTKYGLEKGI